MPEKTRNQKTGPRYRDHLESTKPDHHSRPIHHMHSSRTKLTPILTRKNPEIWFSMISTLLAITSTIIAFKEYQGQPVDASVVAIKDLGIFGTLLILTLVFFLSYRRHKHRCDRLQQISEDQTQEFKKIIEKQIGLFQSLMINTRNSFYEKSADLSSYVTFIYESQEVKSLFNDILDSITTSLARIVSNGQRMSLVGGSYTEEFVSIAIKLRVNGSTAKKLVKSSNNAGFDDNDDCVITLARDSLTKNDHPDREIRKNIYGIGSNTAYISIAKSNSAYFISNDLASDPNYKNETQNWRDYYNATLVVPIWYTENRSSQREILGFLAVDSLNKSGNPNLFNLEETKKILDFGADLLSLLFLNLEVHDAWRRFTKEKEE